MIAKRKHILNSQVLGVPIIRDFKYRGKFNRMWKMGSVTIDDIIHTLYRNYKHLINKTPNDISEKIKQELVPEEVS